MSLIANRAVKALNFRNDTRFIATEMLLRKGEYPTTVGFAVTDASSEC